MSTPEKETALEVLNDIKHFIESLPKEERKITENSAEKIREIVRQTTLYGKLALALVGAENSAEGD